MLREITTILMIMAFIPLVVNFLGSVKMELEVGIMLENEVEAKRNSLLMLMVFSIQIFITGLALVFFPTVIGFYALLVTILFLLNILNAVVAIQTVYINVINELKEAN